MLSRAGRNQKSTQQTSPYKKGLSCGGKLCRLKAALCCVLTPRLFYSCAHFLNIFFCRISKKAEQLLSQRTFLSEPKKRQGKSPTKDNTTHTHLKKVNAKLRICPARQG
jgi:hypothetical protein